MHVERHAEQLVTMLDQVALLEQLLERRPQDVAVLRIVPGIGDRPELARLLLGPIERLVLRAAML